MGFTPETPRDMSPETVSPYPDRPIRPLPKKPLRERLSPDVAQSIKYPPAPKTTSPLFYYGYNSREEEGVNGLLEPQHPSERERAAEIERNYISRRTGDDLESDEDEQAYRSRIYTRPITDTTGRAFRYVQKPDSKHPNPQPPGSTASSADGYDSFENTNNKKKRKIPTPGDSSLNGVHLSSDLAGMGISGPDDLVEDFGNGVGSYHSSGAGHGISGPGRGRYGRIRNGRSPLRTLSDASSNWGNSRTPKQRQPQWSSHESTGIISESIATANAEKFPITPSRGQENVSILQQASKRSTPASAQFTFTCDSQVPGTVPWPGPHSSGAMNQSKAARDTRATQTTPNISTGPSAPSLPSVVAQAKQGLAASQNAANTPKQPLPQAAPKKPRRRPGNEYLIAARERREQQKRKNELHPSLKEDQWTCEFCEYEQIFGEPPVALIKQYEIKDRQARKQEAERRRLLEKAKMKGRKGKKGSKTTPKVTPASHDRQTQPSQQNAAMNRSQNPSQETQSEEYYEDEYDDEYAQDDPPPSPAGAHSTQRAQPVRSDVGKGVVQPGASNGIPAT